MSARHRTTAFTPSHQQYWNGVALSFWPCPRALIVDGAKPRPAVDPLAKEIVT